jgi:hypothetical protein
LARPGPHSFLPDCAVNTVACCFCSTSIELVEVPDCIMPNDDASYCSKFFTPDLTERLEAAAFRSLKAHLYDRSDVLSNMDLMIVSGFCRNCLAKASDCEMVPCAIF